MNNIKTARKKAGYTQQQVADILQITRESYARYESGTRQPDQNGLKQLSVLFNVTIDFLLNNTDTLTMLNTQSQNSTKVPVLGSVAAGIPMSAIENIEDWEEIPASTARTGEFFGLKIKGQSMEPRIMQGDTVIVRKQPDVESGEIAIILINGDEATCKKVTKHASGGITLSAYNTAVFEPVFYSKQEITMLPVIILGKVVELRGKF